MTKLLAAADHTHLPALAIGAFAGLRTSGILALDWRDVRLADRTIKVVHRKARWAGTRLAPATDNLFAWLSPLVKKIGPRLATWPGVEGARADQHRRAECHRSGRGFAPVAA